MPGPQRERGLWSFLTWSFFLSQLAAGNAFISGAAHANGAIDLNAPGGGSNPGTSGGSSLASPDVRALGLDEPQSEQQTSSSGSLGQSASALAEVQAGGIEGGDFTGDARPDVHAAAAQGLAGSAGAQQVAGDSIGVGGCGCPTEAPPDLTPGIDLPGELPPIIGLTPILDGILPPVVETIDDLAGVLGPTLAPVGALVGGLVNGLQPTLDPLLSPAIDALDLLLPPVIDVAEPLLKPLAPITEPLLEILPLGNVGSLSKLLGLGGESDTAAPSDGSLTFAADAGAGSHEVFEAGSYTEYGLALHETPAGSEDGAGDLLGNIAAPIGDLLGNSDDDNSDGLPTMLGSLQHEIGLRGFGEGLI